ncbi:atrial natriuretic peptide receptor 3-like [Asterias amurensis]|uniref:atrial natriuretic peptide receptor 3-like n=1 Tax=Asterias amurensis TaxID=7602 RepID=UPI003AB3AE1C
MDRKSRCCFLRNLVIFYFLLMSSCEIECKVSANGSLAPLKPKGLERINLAVLLPDDPWFDFATAKVVPGIWIAIQSDRVKSLIGSSYEVSVREYDSKCSQDEVLKLAVDALRSRQEAVDMYLGPACGYASANIARLVEHWRKVYVTSGCVASIFDGGAVTRMSVTATKLGNIIYDVLQNTFKWNTTVVLAADAEKQERLTYCYLLSAGLMDVMRSHGLTPESETVDRTSTHEELKAHLLKSVKPFARMEIPRKR